MARDYLRGRTVVYVHPATYLVLTPAALALTMALVGGSGGADARVLWAGMVLFFAVMSRVIFHHAGLNYAEHLIVNMFLFAHAVLLLTVILILMHAGPDPVSGTVFGSGVVGVSGYMIYGYAGVFGCRPFGRFRAALYGALVIASSIAAWMAALILIEPAPFATGLF